MKYHISKYGAPVLKQKTVDIQVVDEKIRQLARDMLVTMYENNGVGLAAPQVGRLENICVIDVTGAKPKSGEEPPANEHRDKMPLVMINPRILAQTGEQKSQEGCLSVPEITANIKRAVSVTVKFQRLDGQEVTLETGGLLAIAVQHELDHLGGRVIVDRMSQIQKVGCAGKLKKLKKEAEEADA